MRPSHRGGRRYPVSWTVRSERPAGADQVLGTALFLRTAASPVRGRCWASGAVPDGKI